MLLLVCGLAGRCPNCRVLHEAAEAHLDCAAWCLLHVQQDLSLVLCDFLGWWVFYCTWELQSNLFPPEMFPPLPS